MRSGATLALAVGTLLACASSAHRHAAPDPPATAAVVVVTGRVTTIGSDPRITLVIVTETEQYELAGSRSEELWRLQQRYLTVRGHVVRQASGPGFPARLEVHSYTLARDKTP